MSDFVSADRARQMLHISKRKCAWLIENGYLKATDSGRKTRRYQIELKDLYSFKDNAESLALPRIFSSKPRKCQVSRPFDRLPENTPDALTPAQIANLLHVNRKTVFKWIREKKLRSVLASGDVIVAKEWLMVFMEEYKDN